VALRPVLVAALAAVLASKMRKLNHKKPATFFIWRRYSLHAGSVSARAHVLGVLPVDRPGPAGSSGSVDAGQGGGGADRAVLRNIGVMSYLSGVFFDKVSVQFSEALCMYGTALDGAIARHGDDHPNVAA